MTKMNLYRTAGIMALVMATDDALAGVASAVTSLAEQAGFIDSVGSDFSLADLANMDTSAVEEFRFSNVPQGIYEFEVVESRLGEDTDKEGAQRFFYQFGAKIVEVVTVLEAGYDDEAKAKLVGRIVTEKNFIHPKKATFADEIGRIKALISDIGGDNTTSAERPFEAMLIDHQGYQFRSKVIQQVDRNDPSVKYSRLRVDGKTNQQKRAA